MTRHVELVGFDLGEVLSVHPTHLDALAEIVHADREAFAPAYWRHRDGYDLGGRPDRYWTAVAGDAGQSVTPDQVAELTDLDASAWSALHPASRRRRHDRRWPERCSRPSTRYAPVRQGRSAVLARRGDTERRHG